MINIPDSLFKEIEAKKIYKLQKIYYYNEFIKDIINDLNERYHIITAYLGAKKYEKTEKKQIITNSFIEPCKDELIVALNLKLVDMPKTVSKKQKQIENEDQLQ